MKPSGAIDDDDPVPVPQPLSVLKTAIMDLQLLYLAQSTVHPPSMAALGDPIGPSAEPAGPPSRQVLFLDAAAR